MKKKLLGIFVCVILITSFLPYVSSSDNNDIVQSTNKISVDDGPDIDECRTCESYSEYRNSIMRPDFETLQYNINKLQQML